MFLNRLKTLTSKLVRYLSHRDFLKKCMAKEIIPKGMTLSTGICMTVSQFRKQRCDTILKDASLMLINELIDGCSETVDMLDRDVNECKQEILRSLNQEQATEIITRCEELKVKEIRKLTHRKNKKLAQLKRQTKPSKKLYEICKCDLKHACKVFNVEEKNRVKYFCPDQDVDPSMLREDSVIGDGNCYFRCISKHLFGTEQFHSTIRKEVVSEMERHSGLYKELIDTAEPYVQHMWLIKKKYHFNKLINSL